jgi:hypothetical protein
MMVKFILIILIATVPIALIGQDSLYKKRVNFSLDAGSSILFPKDKSLRIPTGMEQLDSRIVLNTGFKVSLNSFSTKFIKPKFSVGVNTFRSQATDIDTNFFTNAVAFKNRFVSYNAELLVVHDFTIKSKLFAVEMGVFYDQQLLLFPYGKLITGEEYRGFDEHPGRIGGPYYRGPVNIGSIVGINHPLKKINLGIYYYQRLYFTGFNREMARIMLRVGF